MTALPRIIAHRGASAVAPENTLTAFEAAAAMGAEAVEFDVSLLGDGSAVIHHDGALGRTSDGAGALVTLDRTALAGLDAGAWFDPGFAGTRIPLLKEALDRVSELGLAANLEIKLHGQDPRPLVRAVAQALTARPGLAARTVVSSFDHSALTALREHVPGQALAALWAQPPENWRQLLADMGASALHMDWRALSHALLDEASEAAIPVRVYTCNDPVALAPFRRPGLDAVITDDPRLFLRDPDWADWVPHPGVR
ncbi:MAG: glycerophosphodiester phosphodiesterase family protein [Pseudomonadota bacterium]